MSSANEIIGNFCRTHDAILSEITQIQALRSYPQARHSLVELREKLFAHLKRQDEILKSLSQRCAGDRSQGKIVEFLVYELKDLRVKCLIFFDEYDSAVGDGALRNFPKAFSEFARAVGERISMEEEYLFPLLKKLDGPEPRP